MKWLFICHSVLDTESRFLEYWTPAYAGVTETAKQFFFSSVILSFAKRNEESEILRARYRLADSG